MQKFSINLLLSILACFSMHANGTLDSTFGSENGFVTQPESIFSNNLAIQGDGKILAVGTSPLGFFRVIRYTTTGSLDTTFAGSGINTGPQGIPFDVIIDQKERILVAGQDYFGNITLVRYTQDGSIDYDFGFGGSMSGPIGSCAGLALRTDGKILVGGSDNSGNFLVVQYDENGFMESSYQSGPTGFIEDIKIEPNNNVISVGSNTSGNIQLARYTNVGLLDSSFGVSGVALGPVGVATALAVQSDGKYVVSGYSSTTPHTIILVRFNTDGSLDNTFGTGGIVTGTSGIAEDVLLQDDGKIITIGHSGDDSLLTRYNTNGTLDTTFGISGIASTPSGILYSGALQSNGKIVTVGLDNTYDAFLVARYTGASAFTETRITSPLVANQGIIAFDGTTPQESIVYLFVNEELAGSAFSTVSNTWSINATINTPGMYNIRIVSRNINNKFQTMHSQQVRII